MQDQSAQTHQIAKHLQTGLSAQRSGQQQSRAHPFGGAAHQKIRSIQASCLDKVLHGVGLDAHALRHITGVCQEAGGVGKMAQPQFPPPTRVTQGPRVARHGRCCDKGLPGPVGGREPEPVEEEGGASLPKVAAECS